MNKVVIHISITIKQSINLKITNIIHSKAKFQFLSAQIALTYNISVDVYESYYNEKQRNILKYFCLYMFKCFINIDGQFLSPRVMYLK